MPSAEIITIGTELLLGEIVDTNTRFLAKTLRDAGIDLYRTTTVGDNVKRIAQAIQQSLERCDIVITTGGLGPTIDDPTREAVALAIGVRSEFRPELWEQIKSRFRRLGRIPTENNQRQAYVPEGAKAIENPVGTAPIFILEYRSHLIISLPGVPSEMKFLMEHSIIPFLRQHYGLHGVIKTRVLHTVGVGESQIDDLISDLEELSNPTVGLAAHSGQVDVRITVKAESEEASAILINPLENTIRDRLGDCIYGVDQESLEEVALRSIAKRNWTLTIVEAGLGGYLIRRLASAKGPFLGGQVLTEPPPTDELLNLADSCRRSQNANVGLGVAIHPSADTYDVDLVLITPLEKQRYNRRYGGPPEYAPFWAFNQSLDMIRRIPHDT
jgi:competence/damage-inducible protein CinA-like protein